MLLFLGLCLLARLAYSLNDIFTGRLAREYGRTEVAALRGVSLGLTMAPLLWWVPGEAWVDLGARWPELVLVTAVTALCNLLQLQAARLLPFGLRAAFIIAGMSAMTLILGWGVFDERLSALQGMLCVGLVASAVIAAPGAHAAHEIRPDVARGAMFAVAAAVLMAVAALLVKNLAAATHPFLAAWAWEFGAGLILVAPLLYQARRGLVPGLPRRFRRIALAASPTVIGSGGSIYALELGELGLWGAIAGTQVLFTAGFGALWHRETLGPRRWLCFAAAATCVAGLAWVAPR